VYSPNGVAPSCRTSKPRCCTIPSADVDAIVLLLDAAVAAETTPPVAPNAVNVGGAKLKALVRIELDFKTAHNNEAFISMVGTDWNFVIDVVNWIELDYRLSIDAIISAMSEGQAVCDMMARSCRSGYVLLLSASGWI
jgi:hypothetical protein